MAITLKSLQSPTKRPAIITLVGEGGMGKTSLAAMFPNPVFIRTEDGTKSIEGMDHVALFPVVKESSEIFEAFESLRTEEHNFKTLVIDSITQLDVLLQREIIASDPKAKSINQALGGYGAGYSALSAAHERIRRYAGFLNEEKGMNVVFIAHADSETVEPPDAEPYIRYTMRLHKKSVGHYSDNVDLVGFLKLKTYTTGGEGEKKRAGTTGERYLSCVPTPSHISKNRYGITDPIKFTLGENPLEQYITGV